MIPSIEGFDIVVVYIDTAREITRERPKFLPGLFRARPDLARSPELWNLGGDRKRELFEAVEDHVLQIGQPVLYISHAQNRRAVAALQVHRW